MKRLTKMNLLQVESGNESDKVSKNIGKKNILDVFLYLEIVR